MAVPVRKPPSPSDSQSPRSYEYFYDDLFRQNQMAVTESKTLGNVLAGAQAVLTFTVNGAKKDKGQTIEYGLPSAWNQSMRVECCYVSNDDEVSLVVRNTSGSPINTGAATYGVRVRP